TEERKMKLERLAINASVKLGKTITWTEILGYLIDNYSKDAAEMRIAGSDIMMSDASASGTAHYSGFTLVLDTQDVAEGKRWFDN
ncbi:hypothetical protein MJN51_35715, partial [Salmonella enterica subsp. enterica serovar Kentucky]|nr:hypothetical protein [Salmonella enterica subsp. enterica serovar Kentucky]